MPVFPKSAPEAVDTTPGTVGSPSMMCSPKMLRGRSRDRNFIVMIQSSRLSVEDKDKACSRQ